MAAGFYESLEGIGERLREERTKAGMSQRELARRLGLSASMISQMESGLSKPSVGTLYAIVTELDLSLDRVIRGEDYQDNSGDPNLTDTVESLVRSPDRQAIDLDSGVRWEELTATSEDGVDFLHAIYEVGGASTPDESLMRHHGREYGYIMSGTLGIEIGFREYELNAETPLPSIRRGPIGSSTRVTFLFTQSGLSLGATPTGERGSDPPE